MFCNIGDAHFHYLRAPVKNELYMDSQLSVLTRDFWTSSFNIKAFRSTSTKAGLYRKKTIKSCVCCTRFLRIQTWSENIERQKQSQMGDKLMKDFRYAFQFHCSLEISCFALLVVPFVLFLCRSFPKQFEVLFEIPTGYVLLVADIFFFMSFVKTTKDRRISNFILQK